MEHRRDIQRTYGNPKPDRSILIIRCGCEGGEGVFRGRGENEVVHKEPEGGYRLAAGSLWGFGIILISHIQKYLALRLKHS